MKIFVDGSYVEASEEELQLLEPEQTAAQGMFETLRLYEGRPGFLREHLRRLRHALEEYGGSLHLAEKELREALQRLAGSLPTPQGRGRIVALLPPLESPTPLFKDKRETGSLCVLAQPYEPYPPAVYEHGVAICRASTPLRGEQPAYRRKELWRPENRDAWQNAQGRDSHEALFLSRSGEVLEGTRSNVFWLREGVLRTPGLELPLLAGVTRKVVLQLAREAGKLQVEEGRFGFEELLHADEVFLTGSAVEVLPVGRIEGKQVGEGRAGRWTRLLLEAYRQRVEETLNA